MAGKHYRAFLEHMRQNGVNEFEAAHKPGAREANQRDIEDAQKADHGRSTEGWLKNVDPDADGVRRFKSAEDFRAAIGDPLYSQSEPYRQAVAQMADATDASVLGVSGHAKINGRVV